VAALQLDQVLDALIDMGWVVQVNEAAAGPQGDDARHVLLVDPACTPVQPLVQRLLLERGAAAERFWGLADIDRLQLADVLDQG
jgi:membrane protein